MNRFVLERRPAPLTVADYESAAGEIDCLLRTLPGVIAVYATGGLSSVGISDLDRIAVVEPEHAPPSVWEGVSLRARQVAMHTPFLADVETFARHRWFALLDPLQHVHGVELRVENPSGHGLLSSLIGIEGLMVTRLKLAKQIHTGRIKVRPFLCELYNVRLDLRLGKISEDAAPSAWALTREIASLRSEWWEISELERDRRVIDLAVSSPEAIDEALSACALLIPGAATVGRFPLEAEWRNVSLRATHDRRSARKPSRVGLLGRHSPRAAELRWRLSRHEIAAPPTVVSLLLAAAAGKESILLDRLALVRSYRAFMDKQSSGWSSIGFARIFAKP
jgi:hypothetical protein